MKENPYKRLPPLERKPDGTPYRIDTSAKETGQRPDTAGVL